MKKLIILLSILISSCSYCGMQDGLIDHEMVIKSVETDKSGLYKVEVRLPTQHFFYTDSLYRVGDTIQLFYYKKR